MISNTDCAICGPTVKPIRVSLLYRIFIASWLFPLRAEAKRRRGPQICSECAKMFPAAMVGARRTP